MRRILVELARSRAGPRHGGGMRAVAIDEAGLAAPDRGMDVVAINDALDELATLEPRQAQVVEMKFFGGMTEEEVAGALNMSTDTVLRDWKKAKLWLWQELGRP
jgi:RNA polymerase sigma factor (TIGR02999 family)